MFTATSDATRGLNPGQVLDLVGPDEATLRDTAATSPQGRPATLSTAELGGWVTGLMHLEPAGSDAERIDRLRLLEEVKAAACAAQVREAAAFEKSVRAQHETAGVPAGRVGQGIAAQIGHARRESPHRGSRLLSLAKALVHEMPGTLAALTRGETTEWRATLVARETACLSREDRAAVDAELASHLASWGDRETEAAARKAAYRLDPHAVAARAAKATADRRVTLRPAPDAMAQLSGLLPAAQGVATYAALTARADSLRAAGDPRSRGQIMADTLVERVTGTAPAPAQTPVTSALAGTASSTSAPATPAPTTKAPPPTANVTAHQQGTQAGATEDSGGQPGTAGAPAPGSTLPWAVAARSVTWESAQAPALGTTHCPTCPPPPTARVSVEVQLMMTDHALFAAGDGAEEPAWLTGYGPVPAPVARALAGGWLVGSDEAADERVRVFLRRLYTHPDTGQLVAMESTRRAFPEGLAQFVTTRDRICRTPYCGAPVRHIDHVRRAADGGETSAHNADGLCEACNYAKEAPGWDTRSLGDAGDGRWQVRVTTPTGHHYTTEPPLPPGSQPLQTPGGRPLESGSRPLEPGVPAWTLPEVEVDPPEDDGEPSWDADTLVDPQPWLVNLVRDPETQQLVLVA